MSLPTRSCLVLLLLLLLAAAGCQGSRDSTAPLTLRQEDAGLADLWFITGRWSTQPANGARTEEAWTTAEAGTLMGISRTIQGGRTIFYEHMRVERTPDGVYFIANPGGQGETAFRLVESGGGRAVFENAENDYPTRITYEELADGRLHAMIEGTQRGRPRTEHWYYSPARLVGAGG